MLNPDFWRVKFEAGLPYDQYVAGGTPDQQAKWGRVHQQIRLKMDQNNLIAGFTRRINVLVTSGIWCGDCAAQVPMLDHIAKGSTSVDLRILDRDDHIDLSEQIMICGGLRVPTAVFLTEEFDFVAILGDKTLSRLRARAAKSLGAFCPLPGVEVDADEAAATLADWVREFEFAHLMARLSPKLRAKHGD